MVGVETGAPGRCRPLQKGEPSRQTRPRPRETVRKRRWRIEADSDSSRGSTAHRRRVGDGRASHPAEATRGADVQRSQDGAGRDRVGGAYRIVLARDAPGVRQMGEGLPALRAVVKLMQGLWQRILKALGEESLPGPATRER